ncbi:MAG: hypothetical protein ACP5P4_13180, partial [Steroidobacteraceae bacterium]
MVRIGEALTDLAKVGSLQNFPTLGLLAFSRTGRKLSFSDTPPTCAQSEPARMNRRTRRCPVRVNIASVLNGDLDVPGARPGHGRTVRSTHVFRNAARTGKLRLGDHSHQSPALTAHRAVPDSTRAVLALAGRG